MEPRELKDFNQIKQKDTVELSSDMAAFSSAAKPKILGVWRVLIQEQPIKGAKRYEWLRH
jgi:hypothetical protein